MAMDPHFQQPHHHHHLHLHLHQQQQQQQPPRHLAIMAHQPYHPETNEKKDIYDDTAQQINIQPTYPPSAAAAAAAAFTIPTNPPQYSVFHPTAWQSDMNTMAFMDALQSWPSVGSVPAGPPAILGWPSNPLHGWDMHGSHLPVESDHAYPVPAYSTHSVYPDGTFSGPIFKTEKVFEVQENWQQPGWVEEIPPTMEQAMAPVRSLPEPLQIDLPAQEPDSVHTSRKRRRVPSPPMTNMRTYATAPIVDSGESIVESMAVPGSGSLCFQQLEQQQAEPIPTIELSHYVQVLSESPPLPQSPPRTEKRKRAPTPTIEFSQDIMMPTPSYPISSATRVFQSPAATVATVAPFIGPEPAPRPIMDSLRKDAQVPVFKTQSANSKRGHYASDVWEGHKEIIKKLYIDESKPLREVIRIMENEHGFPATQRMYKARFKQWGFVKNNTEKVVSQILRTKFERDAEGKLSQFTRNGKDVNLQNYLQRKGLTEYDLVDFTGVVAAAAAQGNVDPATALAHVRCRTPPTDLPQNLRLPDRLRFQDTLVMTFKRAFLLWRQEEMDTTFGQFQPSVFTWRVTDFPHLSNLIESARLIRSGDKASGIAALNQAFWAMNSYLNSMDATASFYFFFHRQSRPWQEDSRIALAVWKFLAAYASSRNHNNHPLLHAFKLMYEVIQKEGVTGLRELLNESSNTVADELERAFGREHWLKDLIWHRCFPNKSKLRHLQLIRDMRNNGPTKKIVMRLY